MTAHLQRTALAPNRFGGARRRLLLSCAMGAALISLPAGRAAAQSAPGAFQGNPTVASGSATINRGTGVDTITVQTPTAIINWSTYDAGTGGGTINFLPQGNTGIFQNDGAATSNFSVLNRIIPTDPSRPVSFNGSVISRLRDSAGNVTGPGGSVAFYSPGGIFVSSTATFNVGSLLLTALDPVNFATAGAGGTLSFVGTAGSQAGVVTQSGSQITALNEGSYVAMIAPRVSHSGNVRVNGSAGYIAAESLTLTINQGLFDINIDTGTTAPNPLEHNGSTTGPSQAGGTDNHRIYAVAVPKNVAISSFLSGTLGFDAASSATVENGEIILSAGYNVSGNTVAAQPVNDVAASMQISGTYTSDVQGRASTSFTASTGTYSGDLDIAGRGSASQIGAQVVANGGNVTVGGNVSVAANDVRTFLPGNAQGRSAIVFAANGSTLTVAGDVFVGSIASSGAGASATGGTGRIEANGGTIQIGGDTTIDVYGQAGLTASSSGTPNGTGGTAQILANNGGTVSLGNVDLNAFGSGGSGTAGFNGGTGQGGRAEIVAQSGGTVTLTGEFFMEADGAGGSAFGAGTGGTGRGGIAALNAFGGNISFTTGEMDTSGFGGSGAVGGEGSGGRTTSGFENPNGGIDITALNGSITGQELAASTDGFGGDSDTGAGATGRGGGIDMAAVNGTSPSLIDIDTVSLSASGSGGAGGTGAAGAAGARGGDGLGGDGLLLAQSLNGTVRVDSYIMSVVGVGGTGGDGGAGGTGAGGTGGRGGDGFGGIAVNNGTSSGTGTGTPAGRAEFNDVTIFAVGVGGSGGTGGAGATAGAGGDGGSGAGGQAGLLARGGVVQVTTASLDADGFGGTAGFGASDTPPTGAGGTGSGGFAGISATVRFQTTDPATVSVGTLSASASGFGGTGGIEGASQYGETYLELIGSTATFGLVSLVAAGDQPKVQTAFCANPCSFGENVIEIGPDLGNGQSQFTFQATGPSVISANNSVINVTTDLTTSSGGGLLVEALGTSQINVGGDLAANAGGATIVLPGEAIFRAQGTSLIDVTGNMTVVGNDGVDFEARGNGRFDIAGTLSVTAGSATGDDPDINVSHDTSDEVFERPAGTTTINAGNLVFTSTNDIDTGGSAINVTNAASFFYGDDVELEDVQAGSSITIRFGEIIDLPDEGESEDYVVDIVGRVVAPQITIEAGDLGFQDDEDEPLTGQLGENGVTTFVQITARPGGRPAIIGGVQDPSSGEDDVSPFQLTQAEAERIEGNTVSVIVPAFSTDPARGPDVIVRDLTLGGTATGDGTGLIVLDTPGRVRIEGEVLYANAAAGDRLSITGQERLEIITPTGGIRLENPQGVLSGTLQLRSNNLVVTDQALATQLAANPNFSGNIQALRTNNGPVAPLGYVQAGSIDLFGSQNVFVQNTGTATDFAGLTIGSGNLRILSVTPQIPLNTVAFGRRQNADGSFVTGNAFFQQVDFSRNRPVGPTTYTAASEFNTVNINQGVPPVQPPPVQPPPVQPPPVNPPPVDPPPSPAPPPVSGSEVVLGPVELANDPGGQDDGDGDGSPSGGFGAGFVGIVDTSALGNEALIDEAVASGGDSTLWTDADDDDEEEEEEETENPGGNEP